MNAFVSSPLPGAVAPTSSVSSTCSSFVSSTIVVAPQTTSRHSGLTITMMSGPKKNAFGEFIPNFAQIRPKKKKVSPLGSSDSKEENDEAFMADSGEGLAVPQPGEPGYKAPARANVAVSKLGISPFADDSNSVTKVGGVAAVELAAQTALQKSNARKNQRTLALKGLQIETNVKAADLPDYLKPLPEDARTGASWVNW